MFRRRARRPPVTALARCEHLAYVIQVYIFRSSHSALYFSQLDEELGAQGRKLRCQLYFSFAQDTGWYREVIFFGVRQYLCVQNPFSK